MDAARSLRDGRPTPALAFETGVDSALQDALGEGPGSCGETDCHGVASTDVLVTISGPDTITPGATESYTIMLEELGNPGPGQFGAGLNVHALVDGLFPPDPLVLSENDANAQITVADQAIFFADGEVTHISPAQSRDIFSYTFELTAPADAQQIELVGAMNAFNNNGQITGDLWNTTSLVVTVPEPTSTALALTALLGVALGRRASLTGCRTSS